MTQFYNVETDRRQWAQVKAVLMSEEDRLALMRELMAIHQKEAASILGDLGRNDHHTAIHRRAYYNGRAA